MDKIVNYKLGDKNYRECVACGFKDEIRLQSSRPRELDTRVNQTQDREVEETAVKILQPPTGPADKK
ncbi:YheV family putative metal-binding protein [Microbulbifer bruguierae]|uniref:YheV family putative metal-binding protein n=2 Tax=Microbulbifer bruguierae TaxID=3029061 RepID=A0ABY8NLN0_9GAMM|nr:YheV family putative metal-binding protein [Microbulbifer bruguierae]WGL18513.1 YheV family putative metal-binding protein [Microbulbifer bruguierae]